MYTLRGGGGAPLTHFSRRPPPETPAPAGWKPEPLGRNRAGRGRPARSPPPAATRRRGACTKARLPLPEWPVREQLPARPPARGCKGPASAWAPGAVAPSGGEGDRGREEAVNSPSVRASPRRAPLPRPRRGPPRTPARPGAAPPGAWGTGGESGSLPRRLGRLAERPRQQRRGKSGLTCHYFLRHLGSTCQRPHKALWPPFPHRGLHAGSLCPAALLPWQTPHVCIQSARGFPGAGGGDRSLTDLCARK
ncbi:uncharacterized protein LOC120884101 [Ictidomys tridecemlineatus]